MIFDTVMQYILTFDEVMYLCNVLITFSKRDKDRDLHCKSKMFSLVDNLYCKRDSADAHSLDKVFP